MREIRVIAAMEKSENKSEAEPVAWKVSIKGKPERVVRRDSNHCGKC